MWFGAPATTLFLSDEGVVLDSDIVPHGVYHADKHQFYWWIALKDGIRIRLRHDVRHAIKSDRYGVRGGWIIDYNDITDAHDTGTSLHSAMYAESVSGGLASLKLKPHCGIEAIEYNGAVLLRSDSGAFAGRAYVRTQSIVPLDYMTRIFEANDPILIGRGQTNNELKLAYIKDFGTAFTFSPAVSFAPASGEGLTVIRKLSGTSQSDMAAIQIEYGDAANTSTQWAVDALIIPVQAESTK